MNYRHLNGAPGHYPFAARTQLRKRRNRRALLLAALGLICLVVAAALLVRQRVFAGGQPAPPAPAEAEALPLEQDDSLDEQENAPSVLPRYTRLYAENPDLMGWLEIEGTGISYPVMQTVGDNEYYLRRGFDGLYAEGGSLFLDEHCSFSPFGANSIIYGHNMADGSMFAPLLQYADPNFYTLHPTIRFDSLYETGTWQVVTVFYASAAADTDFAYYAFFDTEDEEEWNRFISACQSRAWYDTGIQAQFGVPLLTLSTCKESFAVTDDRFVVVAQRVQGD